jgi:hypothetical protein
VLVLAAAFTPSHAVVADGASFLGSREGFHLCAGQAPQILDFGHNPDTLYPLHDYYQCSSICTAEGDYGKN